MAVSPSLYLVDKSALSRLTAPSVAERLSGLVVQGLVGVSIVTELEVGFSARSAQDYQDTRDRLVNLLPAVGVPDRAEARAREVQASLVRRGQHRAVGVADLLIAATAELAGLVLLHYDADFDLIAAVTGQPTGWVVPRGSV